MDVNNDLKQLNRLALICKDGEIFYYEACGDVKDPELIATFKRMAEVRRLLLMEINDQIIQLGGSLTDRDGTLTGSMHQSYTDIKALLSSNADHTYVAELEELEDRSLREFRNAAEQCKLNAVKDLITRALLALRESHRQMKLLQSTIS